MPLPAILFTPGPLGMTTVGTTSASFSVNKRWVKTLKSDYCGCRRFKATLHLHQLNNTSEFDICFSKTKAAAVHKHRCSRTISTRWHRSQKNGRIRSPRPYVGSWHLTLHLHDTKMISLKTISCPIINKNTANSPTSAATGPTKQEKMRTQTSTTIAFTQVLMLEYGPYTVANGNYRNKSSTFLEFLWYIYLINQ